MYFFRFSFRATLYFYLMNAPWSICRCLLYTSDAADDTPCVDLGGRRIIKKKFVVHCAVS